MDINKIYQIIINKNKIKINYKNLINIKLNKMNIIKINTINFTTTIIKKYNYRIKKALSNLFDSLI